MEDEKVDMEQEHRLHEIEERLSALERALNIKNPLSNQEKQSAAIARDKETTAPSFIYLWLQEHWLICMGFFLILLAVGWFVSYAFSNDWLGEYGRVCLSSIAGLSAYGLGLKRVNKKPGLGHGLMIFGEAVLIMTILAGYQLYELLSPSMAFVLMIGITALTTVLAIVKNLEALGSISLLALVSTPYMLFGISHLYYVSIDYILILDIGALVMLLMRGWGWVFHVAWFATLWYSSWFFSFQNSVVIYTYTTAFYLLFYIPAALTAIGGIKNKLQLSGAIILATAPVALANWDRKLGIFPWNVVHYLLAASLAILFGYKLARNFDKVSHKTILKYVLGSCFTIGAMSLSWAAIDRIFLPSDWGHILIYLFVQTVLAIGISSILVKSPTATSWLALYFIVPILILYSDYPEILYVNWNTIDFAKLFVATVSFPVAGWLVYTVQDSACFTGFHKFILGSLSVFAGLSFISIVWNLCHNLIENDAVARSVALTICTLLGEVLIYLGNINRIRMLRQGGLALIIFVILRLLTAEIWEMPIVIRTVTFVVTGLLLIGTAWLDKKIRLRE